MKKRRDGSSGRTKLDYVFPGITKASNRVALVGFFCTFSFTVFFCSSSSAVSEVSSHKRAVESKYICIQLISIGALPVQRRVLTDYRLPERNPKNDGKEATLVQPKWFS